MNKRGVVDQQLLVVTIILVIAYFLSSFQNDITGQQTGIKLVNSCDKDGDGYNGMGTAFCNGLDCDDNDKFTYPGAPERCADGKDNDCDGDIDCVDSDCTNDPLCDDDENDPTLFAYWPYAEGSGSITDDASDNNHIGMLANGVTWELTDCPPGIEPCLSFDGVDDRVEVPTFDLPTTEALTFAAWIKPRDFDPSDARIVSESVGVQTQDHCFMASFSDNSPVFRTRVRAGGNTITTRGGPLSQDVWQHVAMVYDGNAGTIQHYIDGNVATLLEGGSQSGILTQCPGVDLWHAQNPDPTEYGAANIIMDDVRFYERALSQAEIQELAGVAVCGDNICDAGETSCSCPVDCNIVCGDGCVTPPEVCDPPGSTQSCTTPDGYPGTETCNAQCDGYGACISPFFCGDNICTHPPEDSNSCTGDCYCGDGVCDDTEDVNNCVADCFTGDISCEQQAQQTGGTVYYLDPISGSFSNSGLSPNDAWPRFHEVAKANYLKNGQVTSGDVVCLLDGDHMGADRSQNDWHKITIKQTYFDGNNPLIIMGQLTHDVFMPRILMQQTEGFTFQQYSHSANYPTYQYNGGGAFAFEMDIKDLGGGVYEYNEYITIQRTKIFTVPDSYSDTWTQVEWDLLGDSDTTAIRTKGGGAKHLKIIDNEISTVAQGIVASGTDILVRGNTVDRFTKDGIGPSGGSNAVFEYNTLSNVIYQAGAHHDMIQLLEGSPNANVVLRGNKGFLKTSSYNGCCASSTGQGIGDFGIDDACTNCLFENNIMHIENNNHGITISKPINSILRGNTVYGCHFGTGNPIKITFCAAGATCSGNVMENNLAGSFAGTGGNSNIVIDGCNPGEGEANYVDPANNDFHLKPGSQAIDAGDNAYMPPEDFEEDIRPYNNIVDVGADEFYP